jgi:serine/threonine protein kinase
LKRLLLLVIFLVAFLQSAQEKYNILIDTGQAGASVWLDDNYMGSANQEGEKAIKDVLQGWHKIKIAKQGYPDIIDTRLIDEGHNIFVFKMEKIPENPPILLKPRNDKIRIESLPNKDDPGTSKLETLLIGLLILILALVIFLIIFMIRNSRKLSVIGKFELRKIIGKGGIATIYKAKDLVNKKIVALKVMDPGFISDRDLVYKFFSEGDAIYKINNKFPNAPVVKVYEFGRDREKSLGIPFIAMELVKGADLLKLIKQNGLVSIKQKLHIAREVARGLGAAHKLGIFHGDITPDNVIVDGEKVTLIDFGVALQQHDNYKNMDASIMGKPVYMSPEQCAGKPIDDKSDVYSLGIILFLMFYGSPPYTSKNPLEIMNMHKDKPLPELKTAIPATIKQLIYRMLEKDPKKRPTTADLEIELGKLKREQV